MRYQARAPLRIDFAGGWTDVPLYAESEGGAVVNAAITRYVEGYIARPATGGLLGALRSDNSYLSYSLDLPAGAGLGASAAQTVLWTTLVRTTISNTSDRREIAEIAWGVGNLLGVLGGKQDEYASALGGINYLTFGGEVGVERLNPTPRTMDDLRSRLVLAHTAETRLSSGVHAAVWERFRAGDVRVIHALRELKTTAEEMREVLAREDLDRLAALVAHNWTSQKALDESITTSATDSLLELARSCGAVAGKACGAGGGGCVLLVAPSGEGSGLAHGLKSRRVRIIDFDFDTYGVHLKKG